MGAWGVLGDIGPKIVDKHSIEKNASGCIAGQGYWRYHYFVPMSWKDLLAIYSRV